MHITFRNTWSFHTGSTFGQLGETYCYSCSRGGPAVRQDPYIAPWAGLNGDDRKAIVPYFWVNYWRGGRGAPPPLPPMPPAPFQPAPRPPPAGHPPHTPP